tara:strand:- start:2208 stop:2456 length:249 start_codon:yes stop_codon:yes gene_type:complete
MIIGIKDKSIIKNFLLAEISYLSSNKPIKKNNKIEAKKINKSFLFKNISKLSTYDLFKYKKINSAKIFNKIIIPPVKGTGIL